MFITYVDRMVRILKTMVGDDGFLGNMHALLVMDDTVILACRRERFERELVVVPQFCYESGIIVNVLGT